MIVKTDFLFPQIYKEKLHGIVTPDDHQLVLLLISKLIEEKKADNIFIKDGVLSYKGSTGGRSSLFMGPDGGTFELQDCDGSTYLIYRFTMRRTFIISLVISLVFTIVSRTWWICIPVSFLLFGIIWLGTSARHGDFVSDVVADIDKNFFGDKAKVSK